MVFVWALDTHPVSRPRALQHGRPTKHMRRLPPPQRHDPICCSLFISICRNIGCRTAAISPCGTTEISPPGELQDHHEVGRRKMANAWSPQLDHNMISALAPNIFCGRKMDRTLVRGLLSSVDKLGFEISWLCLSSSVADNFKSGGSLPPTTVFSRGLFAGPRPRLGCATVKVVWVRYKSKYTWFRHTNGFYT